MNVTMRTELDMNTDEMNYMRPQLIHTTKQQKKSIMNYMKMIDDDNMS